MLSKKPSLGWLLIQVAFVLVLFYITQRQSQNILQTQGVPPPVLAMTTQKGEPGLPRRLAIPKLNVDAAIEYVGLTSQGEMAVPTRNANVGWFSLGTRPGASGSAVITGHLDGQNGAPAVFTNLSKLVAGDKLSIEDDTGATINFVVRESRAYAPGYADEVFTKNDSAHLNLVTCDGLWDIARQSYSRRLVVFTDIAPGTS